MNGSSDAHYDALLEEVTRQEGNTPGGRRAQLDVKLAKDFSHRIEGLGRSIERFSESMDKSSQKMAHLTIWLVGATVVTALAMIVQVVSIFLRNG